MEVECDEDENGDRELRTEEEAEQYYVSIHVSQTVSQK